eukprot:6599281-Karenia_brevis.AAC.1
MSAQLYRDIDLGRKERYRFTMYTDASCSQNLTGTFDVKLCFIVHSAQTHKAWGKTASVPHEVIATFNERQTYISQGEALAPFLALVFNASVLRGSS